ncbi:MAG: glycosyltransferase [Xenococcaceae cyanobacterium MO_188.B32]|nr:glycosyltransferase [Xenococcaceae cyanobacterium MO_188.B32]
MSSNTQPIIGYLLKCYPRFSETFILNEILELERQGVKLHIFSILQPQDHKCHADVAKVKAQVTYIPSLVPAFTFKSLFLLLIAHWQLFWQSPRRYLKTLQFFRDRPEKKRWKQFHQAGYMALELQKLELAFFQTHFANVPASVAELVYRFSNIPYSIFAHAKDIYLTKPEILDRKIASAKFVLTCTGFNHQYLQSISTSKTPIHLSYHGLDLTKFSPQCDRQKSNNDLPLILSVGRFCEKKGFAYLIQACHLLKQKGYQFRCQIVGYGELQPQMEQAIEQLQLQEVITLGGKLTQDKLIEIYRQADIFVLPCQISENGDRDGIPNVLLEAMAMEIPVISTPISGIVELIEDRKTGLLVQQKDSQGIANAIEELINNPELRQQLQQAGRIKVAQQFSLAENIKEIKTLLVKAWEESVISNQLSVKSYSTLALHTDKA